MKRIITIILFSLLLFSCTENEEGRNMAEETGDIVEGYYDNLEKNIGDAKEVRDLMNKNNENLESELNKIK